MKINLNVLWIYFQRCCAPSSGIYRLAHLLEEVGLALDYGDILKMTERIENSIIVLENSIHGLRLIIRRLWHQLHGPCFVH